METFQIKEKTEREAQDVIKSQRRHAEGDRKQQIHRPKGDAEEKIAQDPHPSHAERRSEKEKNIVKDTAHDADEDAEEKDAELFGHLKRRESDFPCAPYLTSVTSPLAAKLPLPSEKDKTLSLDPSILTRLPLTLRRMAVSEKASTLDTPLMVIFFCCSIVRTLSLISSRMVKYMKEGGTA